MAELGRAGAAKAWPGARTAEGPTGAEATAPDTQGVSLPKVGLVLAQADGYSDSAEACSGEISGTKMAQSHRTNPVWQARTLGRLVWAYRRTHPEHCQCLMCPDADRLVDARGAIHV